MTPHPATIHFRDRVAQRIGTDICADALAAEILRAVAEDRTDFARFACRSRTGLPVYRISLAERGVFYAVVAPAKDRVVTLIEPGGMIQRGGKRKAKRLRA